jgi:hypothetical protein
MPKTACPYVEAGYENREAYLNSLKEQYNPETVDALAEVLGPNEDFDALISSLQDAEDYDFGNEDEEEELSWNFV